MRQEKQPSVKLRFSLSQSRPALLRGKLQNPQARHGEIETLAIALESSVGDIKFKKEIIVLKLKKEDLEKFVGEYELSGVRTKVFLKGDSTLYLFVPGQPEYELIPVKPDEFNLKTASGFSVKFLTNDKKEIEAVQFIQPNGIFKATKVSTK